MYDQNSDKLGGYRLIEQLGKGGMGVVYRAYDAKLDREVALKVLPDEFAMTKDYVQRFYREARTAAKLEHPHIVPIYDYGIENDISYVAMRLLTGGTLEDRIRIFDDQLPSPGETATMLKELASAIDHAHQAGVVHRDIKPSNIMFDGQGRSYLVDFGIAKLTQVTSALTRAGSAVGTPLFMSPEQWRSEEVGPSSDQYSLAVVIYRMVTGYFPFTADSPYQLMNKHVSEPPPHPTALNPRLQESIATVLLKALAKSPDERYGSADEFAKAFDQALAGEPGTETNFFVIKVPKFSTPWPSTASISKPRTMTPVQQRNVLLIAVVVLIMALAGIIAVLAIPSARTSPTIELVQSPDSAAVAAIGERTPSLEPGLTATWTPSPTDAAESSPTPTPQAPVASETSAIVLAGVEPDVAPPDTTDTAPPSPESMVATDVENSENTTLAQPTAVSAAFAVDAQGSIDDEPAAETQTPTEEPSFTPEQSPTPSLTASPTATATDTATSTATHTETPSETPSLTPSLTPSHTTSPSATWTDVPPTATATDTATTEPTATATETASFTPTLTHTATLTATDTATLPATATATHTQTPTFTATPSATQTATDTATATATATDTATQTATTTATEPPTITLIPSETLTPTEPPPCFVFTDERNTAIRVGPGLRRGIRASMPLNQYVLVVGYFAEDDEIWWKIQPEDYLEPEADRYWVNAEDVEEIGGCEDVEPAPGSEIIARPTAVPTGVPTATTAPASGGGGGSNPPPPPPSGGPSVTPPSITELPPIDVTDPPPQVTDPAP